jgi:mRNA interferase MazF
MRGDFVLVTFPFTDLSTTKLRPAVVLRAEPRRVDFVLAFISSREVTHLEIGDVALLPTHPEFALTGLAAPSKVRAGKLVTLSAALLRRWLGRLGPLLTSELDRALVAALEINTVPFREEGRNDERSRLGRLHRAGGGAAVLSDLGLSASSR